MTSQKSGKPMQIILEPTDKMVELEVAGGRVPTRLWQGSTAGGIPVHAYVALIAPEVLVDDPNVEAVRAEFDAALQRTATPRPAVEAIPLRMIL